MKILIVTAFFPPQNSIASLRPYSWAKYWSRAGHDVTVLTVPKKASPSDSPMPTDGFKLLEVPIPGLGFLRKLIGGGAVTSSLGPVGREGAKPGVRKRLRQWIAGLQRRYGIAYG